MKVEITKHQLLAIMNAGDILSSSIGVGSDYDDDAKKTVKAIDRFLNKNGFKRKYN